MNVAIIGGGQAAITLLDSFAGLEGVRVLGVADLREDAPGAVHARRLGIETTTDAEALLARDDVKTVIELTGSARVRATVLAGLRADQEVVTAAGAKLMCDLIAADAARKERAAGEVAERFDGLGRRLSGAIDKIDRAGAEIGLIVRETRTVAFNATIEAARAGEAGRAFGLVADRMRQTLERIEAATGRITDASAESHQSMDELQAAEADLGAVFDTGAPSSGVDQAA